VRPPRTRVNRRALFQGLKGRGPAREAVPPDALRPRSGRSELLKATRPGMGSFFEVRLSPRSPGAVELATAALDVIDALEGQMTIYRDDSELSRINATAHLGPVPVERGLFGLLDRAIRIGEETGGAYDVACGALSIAWGFIRGPRRVPDDATLATARARSGQHLVTLDRDERTVRFSRPGVVLNLGSIGKGYAIDRASAVVRDHWWPTPALIHGGQSSLYALGSPPDHFGGRWEIALRNPFDSRTPLGVLRLRDRGLGTSGAAFQRFQSGGRLYGHIIDPRTGEPPADGPASVTVLAPTAAEADALSTAFYLLGPEAAAAYTERHPDTGAIFVLEGPADHSPTLIRINLDDSDFDHDATLAVRQVR
jgi:thiamine biosynthesis lipoprotein